jgi:hypothetical protein
MYRTHRFIAVSAFVLSATLIGPVVLKAEDNRHTEKRYYDKQRKEYHNWNDNEDRAYRSYLTEQHQSYRTFNKVPAAKQQVYFNWRHDHPDAAVKVEIR